MVEVPSKKFTSFTENVVLLFSVTLIGLFAQFAPSLLFIPIILISSIFVYSYIKTFNPTNPLVIAICGGSSVILPVIAFFFDAQYIKNNLPGGSIIILFVCYISVVFLISFGFQIFRNVREKTIETVSHSICVCLIVTCCWGFIFANNIYSGILTPVIILYSSSLGISVVISLLISLVNPNLQKRVIYTIRSLIIIISTAVLYFSLMPMLSYQCSIVQVILIVVLQMMTLLITTLQFGSGKGYHSAILRGVFPVVCSGIFLYLICAFTGVGA